MKMISVLDQMPKPDTHTLYLVQTEEGYFRLAAFDPKRFDAADPMGWYDIEHDSGWIIAWCEIDLENNDWASHYQRFSDAKEKAWEL